MFFFTISASGSVSKFRKIPQINFSINMMLQEISQAIESFLLGRFQVIKEHTPFIQRARSQEKPMHGS